MAKFHAMPTEDELTPEEREQGFHTRKWAGLDSHRCNKCKYNSLIKSDTELHYFYKHIFKQNQQDAVLIKERAVTVPLLDARGKQVAALAEEIKGKELQLPAGYKPPAVVTEVLAKAKSGKTDN